jgi:hypothetical protein
MAKQKKATGRTATPRRATPKKKAARGTVRARSATKKKVSADKPKAARTSTTTKSAAHAPAELSLGRPKITGEEKLYLLFKEDYHARQIFEFLGVETVKELEQFSAPEIVRRLTQPITNTLQRIREKLAEKNRCLHDDQSFAWQHQQAHEE